MYTIYGQAVTTVVVTPGNVAEHWLTRISQPQLEARKIGRVDDSLYTVPLPARMDVLSNRSNMWKTRGWIFTATKKFPVAFACLYWPSSLFSMFEDCLAGRYGNGD